MCKDTYEDIYKICNCASSTLCYSCLMIINTTNICKCPICRTDLKIKYNRDYSKLCTLVSGYTLLHLAVIGIPLIYPIYSYLKYYNDFSYALLFVTIYCIFILEPLMCNIIIKNLKLKYINYQLSKLIVMVCITPLIFLLSNTVRNSIYIILFIFPLYIFPNLIYSTIIIYKKIKELKEYFIEKTKTKQIMFQIINYINENNINENNINENNINENNINENNINIISDI
jgi:hypothetical protein